VGDGRHHGRGQFDLDVLPLAGVDAPVGSFDRVVVEEGTHRVLVGDAKESGDVVDVVGQDQFPDALVEVEATSCAAGPELVGETAKGCAFLIQVSWLPLRL
jgi:hypothetical protein